VNRKEDRRNSIRRKVLFKKKFYGNCDREINKEFKEKWDKRIKRE